MMTLLCLSLTMHVEAVSLPCRTFSFFKLLCCITLCVCVQACVSDVFRLHVQVGCAEMGDVVTRFVEEP